MPTLGRYCCELDTAVNGMHQLMRYSEMRSIVSVCWVNTDIIIAEALG